MVSKIATLETEPIEQYLSKIGAKVADALVFSQQAKEMLAHFEAILIGVQQELEEVYVSIDKIDQTD